MFGIRFNLWLGSYGHSGLRAVGVAAVAAFAVAAVAVFGVAAVAAFGVAAVAAFAVARGYTPRWGITPFQGLVGSGLVGRDAVYLLILRPFRAWRRPRPGSRRHEGGGGRLPPDEEATRGSHRRPMGQAARQQLNTAKSPNWRPKNQIYLEQPNCFEQPLHSGRPMKSWTRGPGCAPGPANSATGWRAGEQANPDRALRCAKPPAEPAPTRERLPPNWPV